MKIRKSFTLLNYTVLLFLIVGAILRFYNLNWGAPIYFHPDERNIADAIASATTLYSALFTGTFSYGNFPIIVLTGIKQLILFFIQTPDTFSLSIGLLRFTSALASVLTLLVIYQIGVFWSRRIGLLALTLATFSVGFIQQAHFGTFDGLVTLFLLLSFFYTLKFLKEKRRLFFILSLLSLALATALKINSILFYLVPILAVLTTLSSNLLKKLGVIILGGCSIILLALLLSPYYLTPQFYSMFTYERGVVSGSLPVFYSSPFLGSTPIFYQFVRIYPFLLNPICVLLLVPACGMTFYFWRKRSEKKYGFLLLAFILSFFPSAVLFTKWTRYMIPSLPYIYIMLSILLWEGGKKLFKRLIHWQIYFILGISIVSILFGVSYIISALTHDTRMSAAHWAGSHIDHNAPIISEVFDPGIVPFNAYFANITLFDFYALDYDPVKEQELSKLLENNEYIILASQRIESSRITNKKDFPKSSHFYNELLKEQNYRLVYQTPCDFWCSILYLGNPISEYEETGVVFDRPTISIYSRYK